MNKITPNFRSGAAAVDLDRYTLCWMRSQLKTKGECKLDAAQLSTENIGKLAWYRLQQTGNNVKIFQIVRFAKARVIVGATIGRAAVDLAMMMFRPWT